MADEHLDRTGGLRRMRRLRPMRRKSPKPTPELAALKRERDDLYDRLLRKTAEFDNYRKRVERERREQADQAVVDLLQRAAAGRRRLRPRADGRGRRGRRRLPQGRRADPREAARPAAQAGRPADRGARRRLRSERAPGGDARTSPEHREGEVIGELRRGYMLGDRLLRPAMVKVAKA